MRIGVGEAQGEISHGALHAHLKGIVDGVGAILDQGDVSVALVGTVVSCGIVSTSDGEIDESLSGDNRSGADRRRYRQA